jgi:protease YdgD
LTVNFVRHVSLLSLAFAMPWLIVAAVAMDQDVQQRRREAINIMAYPWASVGKIGISTISFRTSCTGSVIGPNEVLTAAHCLYNERTNRFVSADAIHFLLGYDKGEYRAHRTGSRYVTSSKYDFAKEVETAGDDWAVIHVEDPFPSGTTPLRLAADRPLPGAPVLTGGYPSEKAHMMTADKHCQVEAVSADGKLIVNTCIVHHGDSGGPLMSAEKGAEGLIIGVNTLGYGKLEELKDQSKEGGAAAAAWAIKQSLASQGTVSRK